MGRLWLALALLVALGAPALAFMPHVPAPPAPRVRSAYVEIGAQRTSTGLYDVELLRLDASFDPSTTQVRVLINSEPGVTTTPDHLELVHPDLLAPVGTVRVYVVAVAADGGQSTTGIDVIVQRRHEHVHDGAGPLALFLAAPFVLALLAVVILLVVARRRARARAAAPVEPLALPAAEHLARAVRVRALLILGALIAAAAYASTIADLGVLVLGFFVSPALIVIAFVAVMRLIDAIRTLRLLARPNAAASVRLDQIEVTADCDRHTLRASRWLVDRARQHALPRARL
ncbi:MAG: hypothetical protein JO257_22155 [Deltaproteobacteria bacterium]|nr:hypothetical protein [Deltaproteobacteria bacterium]